ncbi:class I SAM-dependent methyltransferase [Bacillus sp. AFS015802]|uniref:class I SAM-dependent methyltransferase n=1 Tax=Bacillus sp. AFS015802 TaxID=2033486 RepID=UPI0015CEFB58|nr:class I SAM-dependent methyltransferase [Bacillus sp. AFS015802]
MPGNKGIWENQYGKAEDHLWGLNPIQTLVDYSTLVKKGKVLDLGIGEGRNALYFAGKGYEVEGVDISETAIERSLSNAQKAGVGLKAEVNDLTSIQIEENTYSLIILANVLNFFNDEQIKEILKKAKNGLVEGGLIYINAFGVNDPSYDKNVRNAERVNDFTFYRPKSDTYIHFFTLRELAHHFEGYQNIKASETFMLDMSHGEPHYHGIVETVYKKWNDKLKGSLS